MPSYINALDADEAARQQVVNDRQSFRRRETEVWLSGGFSDAELAALIATNR